MVPKRVKDRSLGEAAVALASGYRLTPDEWQADWVIVTLSRRKDGRWAAATSCLAVPRQNGKNGGIEVLELFGMVALGLRFLHTAHEVKTARKAFRRILSFFENEREFPELAGLVKEIRKTNGQEAIVLHAASCQTRGVSSSCGCDGGGSIEFIARSSGSGRGFTVDVLVCDEAQDLTDDELAALLPTISAAPSGNPLVIITGTPPDPEKPDAAKGEVFRRVRNDAKNGTDPRLCFIDYGVPDGPLPDVDDRELYYRCNPALGTRLSILEVERERKLMSPEKFARERLGWWGDPDSGGGVFGGAWGRCRVAEVPVQPYVLGLATALDRTHTSIATCAKDADGRRIVGAVDRREGLSWAVAECERIGLPVAVDSKGPAAVLIPELRLAGVTVIEATTSDYLDACEELFDAVREGTAAHMAHDELDAAVTAASWRMVGDRRAFGRKSGDISMLEAAALARWCPEPDKREFWGAWA